MDVEGIKDVVAVLRQRLEPVERAELLADTVEGQLPLARKAAVLIGLFDREGEVCMVFILRAATLRSHGGEIAFPGGGIEPTDNSPAAAALREAWEEIGLDMSGVEVLGVLEPVFTVVSNYLIVPVVAFLAEGLGVIQLQASEVTEIILIPLRGLTDTSIYHTEEWMRDGQIRTIYFYDYGPYRIWGATARMLKAFLDLLKQGS
jgi:8-oxo-dGTP pyrophosphatase MutT (NUDIX family)